VGKQVWDITARAEGFAGEIPLEQLRPMFRNLIRVQFRLSLRAGKQDLPYFALVVNRKGAKLRPTGGGAIDFHLERGPVLRWTRVSMRLFASWLEPWIQMNRVILDETGLTGEYDLELRWSGQPMTVPEATDETNGPSIFTALREQLGLR
jgi:uncharacterized protein (TIGR03435 family)